MSQNSEVSTDQNWFVTLGVLALCGGALWGLYLLASQTIAAFSTLDAKYGAALVAAAGTVIVSVISVVISRYLENRANIRKSMREKKVPVYEDLLKFMFKILMGTKTGKQVSEKEMLDFMMDFTQKIMVWGSDSVLNAWADFRDASTEGGDATETGAKLLIAYENLIREIRKDLGHKNKGLVQGRLLSLFVTDYKNYIGRDA